MGEKVRVGVVGTSAYSDVGHLPNLQSHPGALIAAICGRNRARAEELAAKYRIPQVFTDYREMIERGNLDAIVIIAPDDLHYPITMQALGKKLHVLCEKPLAMTVEQAREMYRKAEAAGVKHMVYFNSRWRLPQRFVKDLLDQGYVGRCFDCHVHHVMGHGRSGEYQWKFDTRHSLGILGDGASHAIDLARWYVGDIAAVTTQLSTFMLRSAPASDSEGFEPANDSALLMVRFENGAQGTLHSSSVVHVANRGMFQHIAMHGEAGSVEADISFAGVEIKAARKDDQEFSTLEVPNSYYGDVEQGNPMTIDVFRKQSIGTRLFIDAILEDLPIAPNFYDGLKVQEVIAAALESAKTGCWVDVRQTP